MRYVLPILALGVLALAGCTDSRTAQVVGDDSQAAYNAAASLPDTPQRTAIMSLQQQIGTAVGKPIDPTQGVIAPATIPSTP